MAALQTIEQTASYVEALEKRVTSLEIQLIKNTEITNQIKSDTEQLLSLFKTFTIAMQLGMKFTISLGKLLQWIAGLIVAGGVLYTFWANVKFGIYAPPEVKP